MQLDAATTKEVAGHPPTSHRERSSRFDRVAEQNALRRKPIGEGTHQPPTGSCLTSCSPRPPNDCFRPKTDISEPLYSQPMLSGDSNRALLQ